MTMNIPGVGALYFPQLELSLGNNLTQTLNNTAGDKYFIPASTQGVTGLKFTDDNKVQNITLVLLGNVVNTFTGTNALDCTIATDNQLQIDMDGTGFVDLVNGIKPDGQMIDNDWYCNENGVFPFAYLFDVTSQVTNVDGDIGIRLANGRSKFTSLKVTVVTAFLNILWKL